MGDGVGDTTKVIKAPTVRELIDALSKFDLDLPLVVSDGDGDYNFFELDVLGIEDLYFFNWGGQEWCTIFKGVNKTLRKCLRIT